MSNRSFDYAVRNWLEDGSDRTPPAAIDAVLLAVKTTPQERDLRIPRRFTQMPTYMRYAAVAVIVAIVGVGILALNLGTPGSGSANSPAPSPTVAPTPGPSEVAPGIQAWTPYTSPFHGFEMSYPSDWTSYAPATRGWKATDGQVAADAWPYADVFANPEARDGDSIGLWVWEMQSGEGAELESVAGLKAWANGFCAAAPALRDNKPSSCDDFAQAAIPMCYSAGGDLCRPAILVPAADGPMAFFEDWTSTILAPTVVRVVQIGRPDSFAAATRYGGTVQLLKSILTTMDVHTPEPGQIPPGS
jgi:hypothetical protein